MDKAHFQAEQDSCMYWHKVPYLEKTCLNGITGYAFSDQLVQDWCALENSRTTLLSFKKLIFLPDCAFAEGGLSNPVVQANSWEYVFFRDMAQFLEFVCRQPPLAIKTWEEQWPLANNCIKVSAIGHYL